MSTCGLFAQLNGNYSPDLASIEIPDFSGVELDQIISATSFNLPMVQSLTSNKLTSSGGTISSSEFYITDILTVSFEGALSFSATLAKRGSIVTLSGAKATLSNCTGSGTYADAEQGDLDVTVTKVTGSFTVRNATVNLDSGQLTGVIPQGALSVSGYFTDFPSQKGTVRGSYSAEEFGPFDFSGNIINPELTLTLATTSKNKISGTAVGTFGDYDDVAFKVTGTRNARTGISALTLTSTSVKGVSGKINLDAGGQKSGNKNTLRVLGYSLTF